MTQYSIFTHGTALQVERPETVREILRVGGGTAVLLHPPAADPNGIQRDATDAEGPGTWMHLPLTSTLTTFGRSNPKLSSVTVLYECRHCRITDVHLWDGGALVHQFPTNLTGSFLAQRNSNDINPDSPAGPPTAFQNTLALPHRHPVFSAICVSLFVRWFRADLKGDEYDLLHGRFPDSVVVIAAVGAQYVVD
jgi:hypothetical protein